VVFERVERNYHGELNRGELIRALRQDVELQALLGFHARGRDDAVFEAAFQGMGDTHRPIKLPEFAAFLRSHPLPVGPGPVEVPWWPPPEHPTPGSALPGRAQAEPSSNRVQSKLNFEGEDEDDEDEDEDEEEEEEEWRIGDLIEVDTEDGWEAATIIGPSKSDRADEKRVRFADGVEDDWDVNFFMQPVDENVRASDPLPQVCMTCRSYRDDRCGWYSIVSIATTTVRW
jgi:hypothetical protein